MKILITGGAGYIGTNLIKQEPGINFTICDHGYDMPLAHELEEKDLKEFQGIVHLAALSGIMACEENPSIAIRDNILTANNVFKYATKLRIPVVFTSSQAVKEPSSSTYAFVKWSCEQLANLYNEQDGMNYVVRLANVYGGHEYLTKKQTCVKQFITKFRQGKPLIVHGNGKQKRDFVHVFDVCDALLRVISLTPKDKNPIDVGTGIETSILQLKAMFPNKDNFEFEDTRNAGANSSIADISRAKKLLSFTAKRKLRDYIKEMI